MKDPIQQYVTHATKFGIDGVMETARDDGLTLAELGRLLAKVDGIEATQIRASGRFKTVPKHRLTVEQRVKRLCGIPDEEGENT